MFEKFGDSVMRVLQVAREECLRLNCNEIGTEHLLAALTDDSADICARALSGMGANKEKVTAEVAKILAHVSDGPAQAVGQTAKEARPHLVANEPGFSNGAVEAIKLAQDYCRYYGYELVEPEHLLLAIIDLNEAYALRVLDELGANLPFLRRQIMHLMAEDCCYHQTAPSLGSALISGLRELIAANLGAIDCLTGLARLSNTTLRLLPDRAQIVHMVCVGYLPEFLSTQVAFQRCLLEESLKTLALRTGPIDQELTASLVSSGAQHLRSEVRATIEYLWSHEYRLFDKMLDDAEHDVIGSVIEDLWWAQSEDIALHDLFDSALVDHRRKQALTLQKRRIEISQRITKLRDRLQDTVRQCFVKRSIPA